MTARISREQKVFYAAVGILGGWVGIWGYFFPQYVDWALPWAVTPLHAQFLGGMYLSGMVFMIGALLSSRWASIRIVVPMIAVWTGMLLFVSFFYMSSFDPRLPQVWIWFGAYTAYPAIAAWLTWKWRAETAPSFGPALSPLFRRYLNVQGIGFLFLAVILLFTPASAAKIWPWEISRMLAQIYSAPFFSFGIGSIYAARQSSYEDVRIFVAACLTFVAAAFIAMFKAMWPDDNDPVCVSWLTVFGFASLVLAGSLLSGRRIPAVRFVTRQ